MAIKRQEAEVIRGGCKLRAPSDGQYVQNMVFENDAWHVRKGFGQVVQFDTTLSAFSTDDSSSLRWGYDECLGSELLVTDFGHRQMVSVFSANVRATNVAKNEAGYQKRLNDFRKVYLVNIYDLDTGSRWEEPLYLHTSENTSEYGKARDMQYWHAHYETNAEEDYQRWVSVVDPVPFSFAAVGGFLYFGNPDTGLYVYTPATFRHSKRRGSNTRVSKNLRQQQLDTAAVKPWAAPYGESAIIQKAVATQAAGFSGISYLPQGLFPKPYALAAFTEISGKSLVYVAADRRTIHFSQPGHPTAIPLSGNSLTFSGSELITAVAEQAGNLVIWTENTTWYFTPAPGFSKADTQKGARLVQISDSAGCTSQASVTKGAGFGTLYWMDKRGCYVASGRMSVQQISADIDTFFSSYVTNPLISYSPLSPGHVKAPGGSGDIYAQARTTLKFSEEGVSATYWPEKRLTLFTVPNMHMTLVWHEDTKQWAFWNYESIVTQDSDADDAVAIAAVTRNINSPELIGSGSGLYLVGGIDTADGVLENQIEQGDDGSRESAYDFTSRSAYILQYGRGGGVDRSVEEGEDLRIGTAGYKEWVQSVIGTWVTSERGADPLQDVDRTHGHVLIVDKPIPIPVGEVVGDTTVTATNQCFWFPISVVMGNINYNGVSGFDKIHRLEFDTEFDKSKWTPIFRTSGGSDYEFAWEAPPDRVASQRGWGYGTPLHGSTHNYAGKKVACYSDTGTGLSRTGNRLVMSFDPGNAEGSMSAISSTTEWIHAPYMNLQVGKKTVLMYVPFKAASGTEDSFCMGLGLEPRIARLYKDRTATPPEFQVLEWQQCRFGAKARKDNVSTCAQAVDWVYKSDNMALNEDTRVHARGGFTRMLSRGVPDVANMVAPNWNSNTGWGLYNIQMGVDLRESAAQILDINPSSIDSSATTAAVLSTQDSRTIQKRFMSTDSGSSYPLGNKAFSSSSSSNTGPEYAAQDSTTVDNTYLIDGDDVSTVGFSASVKGDSVSYMAYGFVRSRATKLVIESIKAALRAIPAGRRRSRGY